MAGAGKKPVAMASREFAALFDQISKAALVDVLWCACQLGTDESDEQITTQAARNAAIALDARRDRVPPSIKTAAERRLDSDPEGDPS